MRNDIGRHKIQFLAFLNRLLQIFVDFFRQTFLHHGIIKNIFPKNICYIKCFTHVSFVSFPVTFLSSLVSHSYLMPLPERD